MKTIQDAQSKNVNDTCTDCGSYADIGAVIDEHDTILELELSGVDAAKDAQTLIDIATNRFDDVKSSTNAADDKIVLTLEFGVSAEKMIFQLQNNL